ncbi:MAG: copper chaperone PCu(A)C [Alphaproteobacteria bacterium]|nr:copper chaperone PCu(A)C [Alphaproteobacteria bacterium]
MNIKKCLFFVLFFVILTPLNSACPPITIGDITIGHRWVRPSSGPNTAAYVTITNTGSEPDKLRRVECLEATTVELHDNININGVMRMQPVQFIEIGKEKVVLQPGGLHIMLMNLKPAFQKLQNVTLTLHFEKAGSVRVDFPVKQPAG